MTWKASFKVFPVLSFNGTTHAYRDNTSIPQKHQEAEGKKARTVLTFTTEVETTKGQL
jgi:hypothetical protein